MLTILIASDHKPFREALSRILLSQPFFHLGGICADMHAAISITSCIQPDIVLIDGSSDPLAAIEATKKILSCSAANVIALSPGIDPAFAKHMMGAGALGYLIKQSSSTEIIAAVKEVAKDNVYLCNGLSPEYALQPLPTPARNTPAETVYSFKKSNASFKNNIREQIATTITTHWHGILRFSN